MTPKSPFLIFEEFISPAQCEEIIESLGFFSPDTDKEGNPIKSFKHHDDFEKLLFTRSKQIMPRIEEHFDFQYRGTEKMMFEWYPTGSKEEVRCDNSRLLRKKWFRVYDRDFSCVLFLSDYQDKIPFDSDYEVYGGKLEFPHFGFGFNPQRGTLVIFPSSPHFINAISQITAGDLFQVRWFVVSQLPYLYNPEKFPGSFQTWFR